MVLNSGEFRMASIWILDDNWNCKAMRIEVPNRIKASKSFKNDSNGIR